MNRIQAYQHPFADVFELFKLSEWTICHKEGDVSENVWDKTLAKSFYRIQGTSSSSNYISIPNVRLLPKKALGLTGQYVYLLFQKEHCKNFVIHLDYIISEARHVKVSISNIYKNFKNVSQNSLQIPFDPIPDKWAVAVIRVKHLLKQENLLNEKNMSSYYLRSIQVCSTISIRGIFTSDILYNVQTMPAKFAFRLPKDTDWFKLYQWLQYPAGQFEEDAEQQAQFQNDVDFTKINSEAQKKIEKRKQAKKRRMISSSGNSPKKNQDLTAEQGQDLTTQATSKKLFNPYKEKTKEQVIEEINVQIQQNMDEVDILKEQYNYNLTAKNIEQTAEVKLYEEQGLYDPKFDPKNINKKNDDFVLKPNPIMRLDRVVGWHPHNTCGQIYFNPDPKLSQEILFTQANLLIGFYPPLQKQRLFYERHTHNIDQKFVVALPENKNYAFTICKSLEEFSKDNEITIWSLESMDTTNASSSSLVTFKPPLKMIHSLSVSIDGEHLLLSGKDHQIRDVIIVYKFQELVKFQRVEIMARQLADFELYNVKFNSQQANSIIACGKENIKFYKIKSGHLPGQAVMLNNTARNKVFINSIMHTNEKKQTNVMITTGDGLLYFINFANRQVEKVIQIHEGPITGLLAAPNQEFFVTSSRNGVLRIWTTDFDTLKSEVNTGTAINFIDINSDSNQICVLSSQLGTIAILDLDNSCYNVVMRSHMDNITDIAYNHMTGKLVSVSEDYSVKVWHAESMEQVNEFISENDKPICVRAQNKGPLEEGLQTEDTDSLVAIGFKSGFMRILDLSKMQIIHETLLFQSPLMDIQFSLDNRFMAAFFKSGKIVILNKEYPGNFQPIKNIDYELPNQNYCSLSFSMDSSLLANISSNANTITVWETRNFSLRYHLDLTGDIIQKIQFAPNGKDLVVLTTSSKLKFFRLGASARDTEMLHVKDAYGITDMECVDFQISNNNRFIVCAGKEGVVKVFDYFMRGEVLPSFQAFMGHFQYPTKVIITKDLRFVFSIGHFNGIYKWHFYGDKSVPMNIEEFCEELEREKQSKAAMTEDDLEQQKVGQGMFEQEELATYTAKQIENFKKQNSNQSQNLNYQQMAQNLKTNNTSFMPNNPFQVSVDINKGGYVYEQFEFHLNKLLACGNGPSVNNNLVWNEEQRYICYSVNNLLVVESLNQEKTQKLIKDGNDQIYNIKLSTDKQYLLSYTKTGPLDGFPCVFIYNAATFKKLNQIAISDAQIDSVQFSWANNMLLVVSSTKQGDEQLLSTLTVWDFTEGHKDVFCKSMIPIPIIDSQWNPYLQQNADEFITISDRQYHYWRMTHDLQLQYQEGEMPSKVHEGFKDKSDAFTCLCFVKPSQFHHSVYSMLGLMSGYVWVVDAKTNQFLFNVKVLDDSDGGVSRLFSSHVRIIVEARNSSIIHCWDQSGKNGDKEYSQHNPFNFFMGKEQTLSIDGNFKSTFYNDTGNAFMALSTSGSIWYISWLENCTLRLKYCHNPQERICSVDYKYVSPSEFVIQEEQDQFYTFDQNYQISTSSSDGQIKLWNMHDLEYSQQFVVPKEECVYIAMHQFKPYMITSFTDGWLRFFDIQNSKLLGRTQIHGAQEKGQEPQAIDHVVSIKILPSGNHILVATKYGQIMLIFISDWSPLSIKIHSIASIQTQINQFEFSHLEPYNKWLVGTCNGKVVVYNRKDFNSLNQEIFDELKPPVFNYMDSFNLLDYVSNAYSQTRRCNTLDHYYSIAKRNLVYNDVDRENESFGLFANNDMTLHLSFIKKCNQLFIRNFELHQVVKRIEMSTSGLPKQMQLLPGSSPFICASFTDNCIKLIDFMNEDNQSSIQTLHDDISTFKVCPNGRYVLTAGNKGDICMWNIKKKILGPEAMMHALQINNA